MEDSSIVLLYHQRDERAIAESERKYGRFCFTIAQNILSCREDAEECVNDTWVKAWGAMPPAKPDCLRAFLGRIVRNLALDRFRMCHAAKRGGDEAVLALEELGGNVADPEDDTETTARLGESINTFLGTVSARDRNMFLCRYYYTYPTSHIAKQWGMSENYARNILSRTVRRLKKYLQKEGFSL